MPLPTSGSLSFSQIRDEFNASGSVAISDFRRGAGLVRNHAANTNIPTSSSNIIVPNNFYGASRVFITTGTANANGDWIEVTSFSSTQIGKSESNTTTAPLFRVRDVFFTDEKSGFFYLFTQFTVSGSHTGSWFTSVTCTNTGRSASRGDNGSTSGGLTTFGLVGPGGLFGDDPILHSPFTATITVN